MYIKLVFTDTYLMHMCVCLDLQMGHFGTEGPAMVRSNFPLVEATSLLSVPLSGVLIPSLIYLTCHRQPFHNSPLASFHLEVLTRGWRY